MRKIFILITNMVLFVLPSLSTEAQTKSGAVKWFTIQEAEKKMKETPRPLFIDTYTDWCIWCKRMDSDTFTDPVIADILNNKFYPVKFDAEGKESITFMDQKFTNDGKYGKAHQLAVALLNGQLSYPTVVFVTEDNGKYSVSPLPGYHPPKDMEIFLSFFADKAYNTTTFEEYQKKFVGKVK